MRLATCIRRDSPSPRLGALLPDGQSLLDLRAAATHHGLPDEAFSDMLSFLDAGEPARNLAAELLARTGEGVVEHTVHRLSDVQLLAPLPRPRSIRDCIAFEQHYIGAMRTVAKWKFRPLAGVDLAISRVLGRGFLRPPKVWYDRPIYYKGNPASVVGHEADVRWPSFTEKLDYELELAVVIGRTGRNIPVERARDWIAGYTIFNDFSARDFQLYEMAGRLGPAKSKDFDTGNVLGPYLVTPDEIENPYNLQMQARINGEPWSSGRSGEMRFTFEQMIAAISQDETLHPGDVIGSGTVTGGCGLELDRWIKPGDVVELEIERIGVLRNRIVRRETVN
jgi:2-keto-4-pentenoate hydratase/2-oxohepta-3-ene-1,7-dioic acid hydratase in catechol pathway